MQLNDFKVTREEIATLNVKSAADTYNSTSARENKNIFDRLPEHIAERLNGLIDAISLILADVYNKEEIIQLINQRVMYIGAGDMARGVYDKNGNGIVDNAEQLGGNGPEYYGKAQEVSQLSQNLSNLTSDVKYIKVVDSLPDSPDADTLYLVKK